jgi:predicted nucleic acid-binding protein
LTVASDTGPVIALAKVDRLGVLKALYGAVLIPPAVHGELLAKLGSEASRIDDALNDFLQVAPPPSLTLDVEKLTQGIGPGERQAIALAVLAKSALLLIDDRAGRRVAAQLGIPVTGVVGVLIQAKKDGLISFVRPLMEDIRRNGYWLSDAVVASAARIAGE